MRLAPAVLLGLLGCAGPVEVSRVLNASDAIEAQSATFEPVAIVREGAHIDLPSGTRIEPGRAVVASDEYVHKLGPDDVLVTDEADRIIAIRSATETVQFVPGTATSAKDSDEVRGKLAGDSHAITLRANDRIEMRGKFAPGDAIPHGGTVESSRPTGVLIGGVVAFALAYAPSAYAASQSPSPWDRSLFIPFAGPWMDLANRPACTPPIVPGGVALPIDPCIGETIARIALVASGALQGLGGLLTLFGLPAHSEIVGDHGVRVSVIPTGAGAIVRGTF